MNIDTEILSLCDEAREVFVNALVDPPAPNDALRAAAERYIKHVHGTGSSECDRGQINTSR